MGRNYWKVSLPVRYYVWMQTGCTMGDLGGSSMAQSVGHQPLNAADRVRSQSIFDLWWTVWQYDKVTPLSTCFSPVSISSPLLHPDTLVCHECCIILVVGSVVK